MSIKKYADWAKKYVTTFGMDKPSDLHMAALWEPSFEASGYSIQELDYALLEIARNPPEYRTEHLRKIHESIGERRRRDANERQRDLDAINGFEGCSLCGDTGIVVVPHLRFVQDGTWTVYPGRAWKPIFGVSCTCEQGRRVATCPRKTMLMGLEKYESVNPGWQKQIEIEKAAMDSVARASRVAEELDQTLGPLVAGIGVMPKEEDPPRGREKDYFAENSTWTREDQEKWPHLRKPGPQPENHIFASLENQLARAKGLK